MIDAERRLARRPDVAFVSRERWPTDRPVPRTAAWDVVPDIAIEVISPTNLSIDDIKKIDEYFRAGSRAVWVLYPGPEVAKIYVYASPTAVTILGLDDVLEGGAVLPGFRLPVRELFGAGAA